MSPSDNDLSPCFNKSASVCLKGQPEKQQKQLDHSIYKCFKQICNYVHVVFFFFKCVIETGYLSQISFREFTGKRLLKEPLF